MSKVKLFISYKDKHKIIKSDIIQPIQTGRAISDEIFEDMIGDDTGDNISKDNPRYNELSAQYWVWKHYEEVGSPEYVGFMHYRRHFIFDKSFNVEDKSSWFPGMNIYILDNFGKDVENNLSDKNILDTISDNMDCYAITPYDVKNFSNNNLYMKEHYICTIPGSRRFIWNIFYNTVKKLYPDYLDVLNSFSYGHYLNCCNMFIMKKDLFFEYSEFCFNILGEIDKSVDYSNFNSQELRFLGYLGEYVLTLFIMKKMSENLKIKFLDAYLVMNTENFPPGMSFLQKLFSTRNVGRYKIFTILGIVIKLKRKKRKNKNNTNIISTLARIEDRLIYLENKVSDLQEELILK